MRWKSEAKKSAHIFKFFEPSRLEAIFKPKHGSEAHFRNKTQLWSPRSSQDAVLEPIFTQKRRSGPYFRAKKKLWNSFSRQNAVLEPIFIQKRCAGSYFHTKTQVWCPFSCQGAIRGHLCSTTLHRKSTSPAKGVGGSGVAVK